MQAYKAGVELVNIIQQNFDGGMQTFVDKGYELNFISLPNDSMEVYAYAPSNSDSKDNKIFNDIREYGRKNKIKVHLVDSLNFEGMSAADMNREQLEPLITAANVFHTDKITRITYSLQKVVCAFIVIGEASKETLEAYKKTLEDIPSLVRAVILCDDTVLRIDKRVRPTLKAPVVQETKPIQVTQDKINRSKPIGEDDITNLKIALETMDVDEFLKSI
jgi:hypothetical protein